MGSGPSTYDCRKGTAIFFISRNQDNAQIFYPEHDFGDARSPVLGPDDLSGGRCWLMRGKPGTSFRIGFQRTVGHLSDERKVSWHNLHKARGDEAIELFLCD